MSWWEWAEEAWRQFQPKTEQKPSPPSPQQTTPWSWWTRLTEPISRGWQQYGWLGRIGQPLQQLGYATERGFGALQERVPSWMATPLGEQMAGWERIVTKEEKPPVSIPQVLTGQDQAKTYLQFRQDYFDYVNDLPPEIKQIVNRETRRTQYSGYDARLASAQEIVESDDYSPENITAILKKHEKWLPELVGQILFDPLNFSGAALGKIRGARELTRARYFTEPVEEIAELTKAAGLIPPREVITGPERLTQLRQWLLTPLSRSLEDQNVMTIYLHRLFRESDDAAELLGNLEKFGTPEGMQIGLSAGARRQFVQHLNNIDLDALKSVKAIRGGESIARADLIDDVFDAMSKAADKFHNVGPASWLERFNRWVKSIIGVPLLDMNPTFLARNVLNAGVTGWWDEGVAPLAETAKAFPSQGRTIERFFKEVVGLSDKDIAKLVFRGWGEAPEAPKGIAFGRIARWMEKFQSAASFKAGYMKSWDALWRMTAPPVTDDIIRQLGPHADDFASLIRHSHPGNVRDKVTAFLKVIESPEATAKPLAAYVDQLPPGIAEHWEEMLAPWVKEGLEIEGKSLDEVLDMIRAMRARVDADVAAKLAADAPEAIEELGKLGDEIFDPQGMVHGREEWISTVLEGEDIPKRIPPFTGDERTYWIFTDAVTQVEHEFEVPLKVKAEWLRAAAKQGYSKGGRWIERPETAGKLTWGGLSDKGRIDYWNSLVDWIAQNKFGGDYEDLARLGFRNVPYEEAASAIRGVGDALNGATGFADIPKLSHVAQVQQKAAQAIFDDLERIIATDMQKPRGITADVVEWVNGEVLPAMYDTQTGSLMVADMIRNNIMLNYSRRFRMDPYIDLVFPYHYWFDRSAANWLRRIMVQPAKAAAYFKLRNHIISKDRDLPTRLNGFLPFAVDNILPNWAVNMLFVNPERGLVPFPAIFKEEDYTRPPETLTPLGRQMERMENVLPMYPSPLIQYPLALTGALGEPSQWVAGPQTPPARFIRAASATGWGREMAEKMGMEVPPAGWNIEAPLLRRLGIPEVPTWEEEYWPMKFVALMVQNGEITEDEAMQVLEAKSGPIWEEAQRRTAYQSAWPTLTAPLLTTKMQPAGEPEWAVAKEEQKAAPDYETYRSYFERYPVIGLLNYVWRAAGGAGFEEEAKQYMQWYDYRQYKEERDSLIDEFIRDNPGDIVGLNELRQAMTAKKPAIPDRDFQRHWKMTDEEWDEAVTENLVWRAWEYHPNRGDFETREEFLAAEEEFYRQLETGEAPWLQEIGRELGKSLDSTVRLIGGREGIQRQFREYDSIPEAATRIYQDYYIDAAYKERDKAFIPWNAWKDALEQAGFGDIQTTWDQYNTLPEGSVQRRNFFATHPELKAYLNFRDQYRAEHPEAVWENVEAAAGAVDDKFGTITATELIPQILETYKERGWTEEEVREALGGFGEPTIGEVPTQLSRWGDTISGILEDRELPETMLPIVWAIMDIESKGNPNAVNRTSGATGLMQIMPMHFERGQDPKDPRWNIGKGIEILVDNINRTGDFQTALFYYSGRATRPREPFLREYWEPFLQKLEQFGGAGVTEPGETLTFPGFAAYRAQWQAEPAALREAPSAPGVAAVPATGEPQAAVPQPQYSIMPPVPQRQLTGGGGRARRGYQPSTWWDWRPMGERFTWRI